MRLKDIPKKVWIGESEWSIKFVKLVDGNEKFLGCCKADTKEIFIKVGLRPKERAHTLIHELLHALEFEYELEVAHDLIYRLEGPIYDLVCDNFIHIVK